MVQTTMTGFLSPPGVLPTSSSLSTPPPGQGSPTRCKQGPSDHPGRNKKKSKKITRAQKKKERKRKRLSRACKKDSSIKDATTPISNDVTPMPSPTDGASDDVDILISDNSLTDLLASADDLLNSSQAENHSDSNDNEIIRLESKLVASEIELQGERDERIALQNQIELLMSEIDKMKKIDKNQKCEIRKLVNENDKLKKDVSKFSGIRKYTNLQRSVNDNSTQTENTDDVKLGKYESLKSKLVGITDSLLSALDEDDQGFNVISNPMYTEPQSRTHAPLPSAQVAHAAPSAQVAQAAPSAQVAQAAPSTQVTQQCSARATQPCHPAPVTQSRSYAQATHSQSRLQRPRPLSSRRTQGSPPDSSAQASPSRGQQPQPIPVVQIGAAARHARVSNPAAPSPGGPETIVIGTSLVNGLGSRLHARSVNACCYMYRGGRHPHDSK